MKTIKWQTKSELLYNSIKNRELDRRANGGNIYDYCAVIALADAYTLSADEKAVLWKNQTLLSYWFKQRNQRHQESVLVREPYPIVFGSECSAGINVAMIHHLNLQFENTSLKQKWFFRRLRKNLPLQEIVVAVSKYWKSWLNEIGCNNVKVIYNSFDLNEFQISLEEIERFRKKFHLNSSKPLIYIGNASPQKGVYEVYNALKGEDYELVMTGATNHASDLPVKFLSLSRTDYLCLLGASDIVVTMSKMVEGWNRIAHEAMLLKKPVIGSGTGGMEELLTSGGQIILKDDRDLPQTISDTLQKKESIGLKGYDFVKQYDLNYFRTQWIDLFC